MRAGAAGFDIKNAFFNAPGDAILAPDEGYQPTAAALAQPACPLAFPLFIRAFSVLAAVRGQAYA